LPFSISGFPSSPISSKMIWAWLLPGMKRVSLPVRVLVAAMSYMAKE
jgi:hypothetical protein